MWESNLGPVQEKPVLITAKLSFRTPTSLNCFIAPLRKEKRRILNPQWGGGGCIIFKKKYMYKVQGKE